MNKRAPERCTDCYRELPASVLKHVQCERGVAWRCPNCTALAQRKGTKLVKFEQDHQRGVLAEQLIKRARKYLKRTGCKCEACKQTYPIDLLSLHHIIPRAAAPEFRGVSRGLQFVLCKTCHALEHQYYWPRGETLLASVCRIAKPWVRPGERSGLFPHPAWTDAAA